MSAISTIKYNKKFHLYEDAFDENNLYLEVCSCEHCRSCQLIKLSHEDWVEIAKVILKWNEEFGNKKGE